MAKKKIIWYGITKVSSDLKIRGIEVERVTESRLYLADVERGEMNWNRKFVNKDSSYEAYFETRKEAVAEKTAMMKRSIKAKDGDLKELKELLKLFMLAESDV